jgi:hypothetical protein
MSMLLTGEEDIEVVANDRKTELRGRIDSGGRLGIVVGGLETTSRSGVGNVLGEEA